MTNKYMESDNHISSSQVSKMKRLKKPKGKEGDKELSFSSLIQAWYRAIQDKQTALHINELTVD